MENRDTFCAIKIFVFFSREFTKMQLIFLTESWIISRIPYRVFANSRVSIAQGCNSQKPRSPFALKIPNSYLLTRQGSHIRVPYDPPFSPLRQVLFRTIGGFQNRLLVKYVLSIIQQQGYQVVLSTFSFRFRSRTKTESKETRRNVSEIKAITYFKQSNLWSVTSRKSKSGCICRNRVRTLFWTKNSRTFKHTFRISQGLYSGRKKSLESTSCFSSSTFGEFSSRGSLCLLLFVCSSP